MVRKFGPFDTSQFYEVENRRMQKALAQAQAATGFTAAPSTGQGLVTAGTGAQLVIAAYPDGALVDGLYVENPAAETVTLTTNTGSTNPRIDRLVMRLDMTAKTIAPVQIQGTPAASPAIPPLVNTGTVVDMPLCRYTFPGSALAQNPGSIVDERPWLIRATEGFTNTDTDSGGNIIQPHGLGRVPSQVQITPGPQANNTLDRTITMNYTGADATNFSVYVKGNPVGSPLVSTRVQFAWRVS